MKAKKSLGQHFLIQEAIAQRIANEVKSLEGVSHILEVGPGRGILTQFLLERPEHLAVVELDKDLIPLLANRFHTLAIHQGDFLRLPLHEFMVSQFHLVGNFPYNISSQILFKMLENKKQIPQLVGMFQKEVAQRICSSHGSKRYGILSVLLQAYYDVEYLFTVKPGSFSPAPKVESAVIRVLERAQPLVPTSEERSFRTLVKLAFGQRRKMLRNSLKQLNPDRLPESYSQLRPEQLSVADFADLNAKLISSRQQHS